MAQSEPVCVYCRLRPMDPASRPFCSERCRLADLGRWLSEDYRVADDASETPTTAPPTDRDENPDGE